MRSLFKLALAVAATLPVAGCMTSGTNMHGDFACRAPNGTCAPMSSIDAKAVTGIGAAMQPIGGIVDPALPREGRVVTVPADGALPGRTSDRVLRVVFPAHIDPSGIYHDEATAHAVIERGDWADAMTGGVRRTAVVAADAATLQPDRPDDSYVAKLATLDEVVAARAVIARQAPIPRPAPPTRPASVAPITLGAPVANDLREVAAAASAPPVSGLDPNYDTPDVAAVVAAAGDDGQGTCTVYRKIRRNGHAYRRPFQRRCPTKAVLTATEQLSPSVARPDTTRSLNFARLAQAVQPPLAAPMASASESVSASRSIAAKAAASSATLIGPRNPADTSVTTATPVIGTLALGAPLAPTEDRQLAAKRVRSMAAPLLAETARRGRDEARAQDVSGGEIARTGAPSTVSAGVFEQAPR